MESAVLRSPTVGSLIKKVVTINPDLTTSEIIDMMRQSVRAQGAEKNEFASVEVVNEEQVLGLARASLAQQRT